MVLLIRFVLISLIIYLIVRSFKRYDRSGAGNDKQGHRHNPVNERKVSKEAGEYIDYEEVD